MMLQNSMSITQQLMPIYNTVHNNNNIKLKLALTVDTMKHQHANKLFYVIATGFNIYAKKPIKVYTPPESNNCTCFLSTNSQEQGVLFVPEQSLFYLDLDTMNRTAKFDGQVFWLHFIHK